MKTSCDGGEPCVCIVGDEDFRSEAERDGDWGRGMIGGWCARGKDEVR